MIEGFTEEKNDGACCAISKEDKARYDIKAKIEELARINNFDLTDNVDKIIRAKIRFFGEEEWRGCPCDRDNASRFCCSTQCQKDVRETGLCHCSMFKRKD